MIAKTLPLILALIAAPLTATAATPDPRHQVLAALAGRWSVTQSLWLKADAPPRVDIGVADFAMVLGGHQLRQSLTMADGTAFEGLGFIGFDSQAGHYYSTWMDTNFTGLVVAWGDFDATANTYVFRGAMDAPAADGGTPVREVMTIQDASHFRYEYFESHAGKESLTVRLDYVRAD